MKQGPHRRVRRGGGGGRGMGAPQQTKNHNVIIRAKFGQTLGKLNEAKPFFHKFVWGFNL